MPLRRAPPEVWAEKIGAPVGRLAVHRDVRQASRVQIGDQSGDVEGGVDRIARRRVRGLEVEMRRCGQAVAGAAQRHARGSEASQIVPACRRTMAAETIIGLQW